MKEKLIFIIAIISLINAKNLRFLAESRNVVDDASKMVSLMKDAGAGGFTGCMAHIGMVIDAYYTIATTFSTTVTNTLSRIRTPTGFKKFTGSVEYDFTLGFREKGYLFFAEDIAENFKVPELYKESFLNTLDEASYTDKNTLADFNFVFNKEDQNNKEPNHLSYINLMIYHYRDKNKDKFDAIITSAEVDVQLMDVEYIWNRSKSVAGGIKKVQTDYSEFVPRDMTLEDVEGLIMFFQVAAYKDLAKLFGVNFDIIL